MENRRRKMTKQILRGCLIEMLGEMPLSEVSVRELCKRADINRSTFYDHYVDLQSLCASLEEETIEHMVRYMENRVRRTNQEDALTELLSFLQDNARLYLNLLNRSGTFVRRIEETVYRMYEEFYRSVGREFSEMERLRVEFNTAGAIKLIQSWLLKENRPAPREIAKMSLSLAWRD